MQAVIDLYVLRHAKAQERTGAGDTDRKLVKDGIRDAKAMSNLISLLGIRPKTVASSPLMRAKQTAEIAVRGTGVQTDAIELWDELKPEASAESTVSRLDKLDGTVMIVGHEPHMSSLVAFLASSGGGVNLSIKKGALLHIRITSLRHRPAGTIRSIINPKHARALSR